MNIGIDISQMCYEGTGVARYVYGLTRALLLGDSLDKFTLFAGALRQRSYFTNIMKKSPWDKAAWKILPLPPKLAGLALNALPIRVESLIGRVDIFHSSDWAEPSSTCPRVTTVHDLVFKKYPSTVDPMILSTQTKRLKKIISSGTHIIADSMSTKLDLVEIYGLSDTRIDVVYPGIDPIYSPQTKQEIERVKNKYKLPDRFVLSVGTQEPRKNIERLIKACKLIDIPLVLIGKYGWGGVITSKVISLGFVCDIDLPAIYSAATVFAYPSLYEGFGFPVLEAMACGTAVVTSNISSLPEICGGAAILIDPLKVQDLSSGLEEVLSSSDKLVALGLAQAKKFTWAATATQVLEVYEKITHRD